MKSLMKLPAMVLGLLLLFGTSERAKAQNEDVSLQSFYDELSPYGTWINDPEYGYVWRPDVDQQEFRPYYSNGRWAMTEYGNTWVSNYDWGWAPFHYGRWIYNRYNNWIWIPDTVWGPAWVNWRSGGGYYGWAPMGPTIGIHIRVGRAYRVPDYCWNFTPYSGIYVNTFPRYYGYRNNNVYIQKTVIINNTYVRNNRTYYTGPRADEIRRYTNRDVKVYSVRRSERAGATRIENNTVNIYNPRPSRGSSADAAPRNAVAANVRTQVVGRDNAVSSRPTRGSEAVRNEGAANTRPSRGNDVGVRNENSGSNRPTRGSEVATDRIQGGISSPTGRTNDVGNRPGRGNLENGNIQRAEQTTPNVTGQTRERSNTEPIQPQRIERQRTAEAPQRAERPQTQQAPQRVERQQQAQPQRTERSSEQRSSGGRESSRGGGESRGGGGGRPGRG